jgi:hypothetical protein
MTTTMSVQVKKCQLRNQPSFMGKIVTTLSYGDQVTVSEEKESWLNVVPAAKGSSGWVHISALSAKQIVLNADSRDVPGSTSSGEIALAGKGFNQQVEQEYQEQNRNVDFSWVDKMEKIVVSQQEIQSFLQQGGLAGEGGKS